MNARKRFLFALLGCSLCVLGLGAAPYRSTDGAFTLELPEGWRTATDPDEAFPVILGPQDDIDAPSVVATAYPTSLGLLVFADEALKDFSKMPGYALQRRDSFLTANRRQGIKTVARTQDASGAVFAQIFYFIEGRQGGHYVFVATLPMSRLAQYEKRLDGIARSFCDTAEKPVWTQRLMTPPPERLLAKERQTPPPVQVEPTPKPNPPRSVKHRGGR